MPSEGMQGRTKPPRGRHRHATAKEFCLMVLLILQFVREPCFSQQPSINIEKWPGDFGELVRMQGRGIGKNFTPEGHIKHIDLMASQGQFSDALERCKFLENWSEHFKKEPWASELRKRTSELERKASGSLNRLGVSKATIERLRRKLPTSHIREVELPNAYRQEASEERLKMPFVPRQNHAQFAAEYPVLTNYLSLERFWKSPNGMTVAFVIYSDLGPFFVYSTDSGKKWWGPFYLGLHRLPRYEYILLSDSKLPLVEAGHLQVEVTIWNVDRSKPGGPLMGYKYHWKQWQKMLLIPIEAITKDSDGDGLTDIFEERILTDPNSKDSDNDGIEDASDNQPLAPLPKERSEFDNIFLTLCAERVSTFTHAFGLISLQPGFTEFVPDSFNNRLTRAGVEYYTATSKRRIPATATTFVQAEIPVLGRITGDHRWIVLNREAAALYREKFGDERLPNYLHLDPLLMDPSGRFSFLSIRHSSSGEGYALEKHGDQWLSKRLWMAHDD
jgi:hypothetical protein